MKRILAFIFIFTAMVIWGTSFLVMKNTLDNISSGLLIFSRSIITFIVLLPFVFKNIKKLTKKNVLLIIVTGIFVSLGYLFQAIGLNYTTPGKSAFLEDAYCVVVPILTCIILKKKLSLLNLVSILLCMSGVVLISLDSLNGKINIGDILSLLAGIFYGVNITLTGLYSKDIEPITYTCFQFFIISIISGIYTLIFEKNNNIDFDIPTILRVLYLGLIVTALAWVLRNYAQGILSPISVSIILPFSAVVGTIISIIAKEDTLNMYLIIGGILITLSILIDSILPKYLNKNKENVVL